MIDEETLEIRAVEVTSSNISDAPMLPELQEQNPPDQDIGSVTAGEAFGTATVMMQLPRAMPMPSFRRVRMQSFGKRTRQVPEPATKPCGHLVIWGSQYGGI